MTGTSDYLDTAAVAETDFAADPDASKIGLLYDAGQDSSTAAIASAKAYLDENGIEYVEHTGSTADEVVLAAQAMVADGVDAVFTPTDNSIMKAELAIYETFIDAGIRSIPAPTPLRSTARSSVMVWTTQTSARDGGHDRGHSFERCRSGLHAGTDVLITAPPPSTRKPAPGWVLTLTRSPRRLRRTAPRSPR